MEGIQDRVKSLEQGGGCVKSRVYRNEQTVESLSVSIRSKDGWKMSIEPGSYPCRTLPVIPKMGTLFYQ